MSILTEVSRIFESTTNDGKHQSLVSEAVTMLTSREGGLTALTQIFERNGLGQIISSWIGTGENAAISPDQIKAVLGSEGVANLAKRAGISPDTAAQYLTKSLPNLVDALTPDGKVGSSSDLLSRGKEILAAFASTSRASSPFQRLPNKENRMDRFEELKQKYANALAVVQLQGIRLTHLHVQDNKLFIQGTAPSEAIKNALWNQIKATNPACDDIAADITIDSSLPQPSTASGPKRTYTVRPGDSLSKIAKEFYGSANDYMRIFDANKDKLNDPNKIQIGQELVIPGGR